MRNLHNLNKRKQQQILIAGCILGGIIFFIMAANVFLYRRVTKEIEAMEKTIHEKDVKDSQTETKESFAIQDYHLSDWKLVLVNPWNKLPVDFAVELATLKNGQRVDERILPDLQEMMDAARAEGLEPMICSAYRTNEKQTSLYLAKVEEYLSEGYSQKEAEEKAGGWVAVPGTSEHQTGLAVDIVSADYQVLDEKQEDTDEQKWLMAHSWEYGFILRYPSDKSEITGINYEPWHYRYVGKEIAKEIYERGICLEEY